MARCGRPPRAIEAQGASPWLRFASGARGVLEASRVSVGEQNNYGFEVHGTKGAVFWDFRRMNELGVSLGAAYQDQAVTTLYVGPTHGFYGAFHRREYGWDGSPIHDAVAVAHVARPELLETVERGVRIDTGD